MTSLGPVPPAAAFKSWMMDAALPLWSSAGVDPNGGFHELLDKDARPVEAPRRMRLTARQLYSLSIAYRLGWGNIQPDLLAHGWAALRCHLHNATDGVIGGAPTNGVAVDARFSRYDRAFVLLALAALVRAVPGATEPVAIAARMGDQLMSLLMSEGTGRDGAGGDGEADLANPLMHAFEAFLAWSDVPDADPRWRHRADRIAELVADRLFDRTRGVIVERFERGWHLGDNLLDRIVEPGHQFEWATLLLQWNRGTGSADIRAIANRLAWSAEHHGIGRHGFVISQMTDDMRPIDVGAKLWPQCERVRFHYMALLLSDRDDRASASAATLREGLAPFLSFPIRGLWHEQADANGRMIAGSSKASSLYHLVTALLAVDAAENRLGEISVAPRQAVL